MTLVGGHLLAPIHLEGEVKKEKVLFLPFKPLTVKRHSGAHLPAVTGIGTEASYVRDREHTRKHAHARAREHNRAHINNLGTITAVI